MCITVDPRSPEHSAQLTAHVAVVNGVPSRDWKSSKSSCILPAFPHVGDRELKVLDILSG